MRLSFTGLSISAMLCVAPSLAMAQAPTATNSQGGTALGAGAIAPGINATAAGQNAQATGQSSVAIGVSATATQFNSLAIGVSAASTATNGTALGTAATASSFGCETLRRPCPGTFAQWRRSTGRLQHICQPSAPPAGEFPRDRLPREPIMN